MKPDFEIENDDEFTKYLRMCVNYMVEKRNSTEVETELGFFNISSEKPFVISIKLSVEEVKK